MTAPGPDAAVSRVLAALGIDQAHLSSLGSGLASDAWRVDRPEGWFALRIARERPGAGSTYEMEHALMGRLAGRGARVPRPVQGSWQIEDWPGPPYSLTTGLDGAPLSVADHPRAAPALAAFLRLLHAQAIGGFGALGVRDGRLHGQQSSMAAGLLDWARRPLWPLGEARLDIHSALADRDTLRARLEVHAPTVRRALGRGPGVPLHSDLHEENILDAGGSLGIIDFGEALIGPAAWEFASLGYFMEWPFADATLEAYAADVAELTRLRKDANAIGLCFGVYRWAQDHELGIDEDAYDEAFLSRTLSRM